MNNAQHNLGHLADVTDLADDRSLGADDLPAVWDALTTPVYRVVDEDGVNVSGGQCRPICYALWLYADDVDGWSTLSIVEVERLRLVAEDQHRPAGWDSVGTVIDLTT